MNRWTKGFLLTGAAGALAVALPGTAFLWGSLRGRFYRGPAEPPPAKVERARVVSEARRLVGLWYDPLQGAFGDLGGRLGLIVCMDVPRLAYANAGAPLLPLLEADWRRHPEHYGSFDGAPGDPYFDRRARNLHSYCRYNGCLDLDGPPKPGDVVFLSRGPDAFVSHIALVSVVRPDGSYDVVESSRDDWYVTREHAGARMMSRGWTFRGFGTPLRRVRR